METFSSHVLNQARVKALEVWLQETGVKLTQTNGQRKYGGPPDDWCGAPPGAGCEVFISQIPREVYEDRLIPLFRAVGPLWEFRLKMNFSGQNRGFAYAKYGSPILAAAAVRSLHGHTLEPGARLSVWRSTEKRHICLTGLPTSTGKEKLLQVLQKISEGVDGVSLQLGPGEEGVTATVMYSSHHAASMAKKVLVEAFEKCLGLAITVKWQSSAKQPPRRYVLDSRRPSVEPPPIPQPPGFSRAVAPMVTASSGSPRAASQLPPVDALTLLQGIFEVYGRGEPLYQLRYLHTGADGFLYFGYKMYIPGLATPFTGTVQTLPRPNRSAVQKEAHRAVAQQVLSTLYRA